MKFYKNETCVCLGDQAIVKLLIDSKADVNAENINRETPICMAARNGMSDAIFCVNSTIWCIDQMFLNL